VTSLERYCLLDLNRHIRDAWVEGVKHEHELVIANVRRTALHRRDDATLCVCMTCGITWREDTPAEGKDG
jgi:hypothetical protein